MPVEISIGVATPFTPTVVGVRLHVIGAVSGTFWLSTYSRWPFGVGVPAINMGMVAELADVALRACGDPMKRSTTSPFRSVAHKPKESGVRFTIAEAVDREEKETCLVCSEVEMGKLEIVLSLFRA